MITAAYALAELGASYIKKLQAQLHVPQTGVWDNATEVALQKFLKVTADGLFGTGSIKALQTFLKITSDGLWGDGTTAAFKKAIDASRFGTPIPTYTPPTEAEWTALKGQLATANNTITELVPWAVAPSAQVFTVTMGLAPNVDVMGPSA